MMETDGRHTRRGARNAQPFILEFNGPCNNSCVFCAASLTEHHEEYEKLRDRLAAAAAGATETVFTGSEPTLHPRIGDLIRDARALGFHRVRLETNGRIFSYEKFARSVLDARPSEIAVLFPAADAGGYDALVRVAGAFAQMENGLKNLRRMKPDRMKLIAMVPLLPANIGKVREIVAAASGRGFDAADITAKYAGGSLTRGEILAAVEEGRRTAQELGLRLEAHHEGLLVNVPGRADREKEARRLLFDLSYMYLPSRRVFLGATLHVTFRCNMKCPFCTAPSLFPDPAVDAVRKSIRLAVARGYPRIVFTGGEPTIHRELKSFIRMARDGGIPEISLFTNGLALSDPDACAKLADAGLGSALVSLHAHREDLNERITGAPGAFDKTRRAVLNLRAAGIAAVLSCVVNTLNYIYLMDYVDFVKAELGGAPINFSYTTLLQEDCPAADWLPGYTSAAPHILAALDRCDELGITCCGLEPHWGIPPCVLNADRRYFPCLLPFRQKAIPADFVKPGACAECGLNACCFGVRKSYAKIHGLAEIRPVRL